MRRVAAAKWRSAETSRGTAAAATWRFRGGDTAAATWIFGRDRRAPRVGSRPTSNVAKASPEWSGPRPPSEYLRRAPRRRRDPSQRPSISKAPRRSRPRARALMMDVQPPQTSASGKCSSSAAHVRPSHLACGSANTRHARGSSPTTFRQAAAFFRGGVARDGAKLAARTSLPGGRTPTCARDHGISTSRLRRRRVSSESPPARGRGGAATRLLRIFTSSWPRRRRRAKFDATLGRRARTPSDGTADASSWRTVFSSDVAPSSRSSPAPPTTPPPTTVTHARFCFATEPSFLSKASEMSPTRCACGMKAGRPAATVE